MINALLKINTQVEHSISTTTRQPRYDEVQGNPYYFIRVEEFETMIHERRFLEWAPVLNNYYGTTHSEIDRILKNGHIAILDIDIQGALQIKRLHPEVTTVFIEPPSLEILGERLRRRGTETDEQITERLTLANEEMKHKAAYDYTIVNDTVQKALVELQNIIHKL